MREGAGRARRVLAVDLGGTRMRAAVVDSSGHIVERRTEPTPRDAECPDALISLAGDLLTGGGVASAVIGVPGRVDYRYGRLEHAPNLPPHWPAVLDQQHLRQRLGVRVAIANDGDLAAVGEACFGAGADHEDVAYLTVSTGVGAGVLLGRRLVAGRRSLAEIGHTVLDHRAARDGQLATLEDLGSGTALERDAAAAGLEPDGARVVAAVERGDPAAQRVWDTLVAVLGVGVTNLGWLFTPQIIVLGGGVGRNGDLLLEPLATRLRDHGPPNLPEPIELAVAALGDDAGLAGAAGWDRATGRDTG